MKKEELIALGLTEAQADKVVSSWNDSIKNGFVPLDRFNEVNTAKKKLEGDLEERDKQLDDLSKSTGDIEELKNQITTLQSENKAAKEAHEKELKELKVSNALEKALTDAKAKNSKAVQALLELGNDVELDEDGTIKGLDEKIKALKESDAYLFNEEKQTTKIDGAKPTETNPSNPNPAVDPNKPKTYEDFVAELEAQNNQD